MFLLFVIIVLPGVWKEVIHKGDAQVNTALSFHSAFLVLKS